MKNFRNAAVVMMLLYMSFNTVYGQTSQTFRAANSTGMEVNAIYLLSSAPGAKWSDNLNPIASLGNGNAVNITATIDKSYCTYTVKFIGDDGNSYTMTNVNLCLSSGITLSKTDYMHNKNKDN